LFVKERIVLTSDFVTLSTDMLNINYAVVFDSTSIIEIDVTN